MADPTRAYITTGAEDDGYQDPLVGQVAGTESSLSNWAGPYVTDMLGRGQALGDMPYEAYTGPLTAGPSDLQNQAFGGIAGLTLPEGYGVGTLMGLDTYNRSKELGDYGAPASYGPSDYQTNQYGTDTFDNAAASRYMSPYIEQALDPQLQEMARQSAIQRLSDAGRLTRAGAYGGGRQAIMDSERNDNMMRLMAELTGKGYQNAYESAGRMFTSDQARALDAERLNEQSSQFNRGLNEQSRQFGANLGEQSRQFGAGQGLAALRTGLDSANVIGSMTDRGFGAQRDIFGDQLQAGDIQRGITSEGIAADKAQFEEERDFPYKQVQYLHSLLGGMPLAAQNTSYVQPDFINKLLGGIGSAGSIIDLLGGGFGDGGGVSDALDFITDRPARDRQQATGYGLDNFAGLTSIPNLPTNDYERGAGNPGTLVAGPG